MEVGKDATAPPGGRSSPVRTVEPPSGLLDLRLGELWGQRELLGFLIWRDIKVRYKQTFFGAAWALLQPLALMIIFSVFLGRLARVPSDGVAYPLFIYCGLVPWVFISQSVVGATQSLVESAEVIGKVYFPRLLIPTGAALSFLIDAGIAVALLFGLTVVYDHSIGLNALALPAFFALAVTIALGMGFFLSALNARYRDVQYAIPVLIQLLMFASPIVYPSSLVPDAWSTVYGLNPIVGVVDGFRWALLGTPAPSLSTLIASSATGIAIFFLGLGYFQRAERTLADVI